jgi:hypothetical protein
MGGGVHHSGHRDPSNKSGDDIRNHWGKFISFGHNIYKFNNYFSCFVAVAQLLTFERRKC